MTRNSNKQDADKEHCDATSEVQQHEVLIYTWPMAMIYWKKGSNSRSSNNQHNKLPTTFNMATAF